METNHDYLIAVSLTFDNGKKISETVKVRAISEGNAKVAAYAKVRENYSCEKIDDRLVICLGLCEPA